MTLPLLMAVGACSEFAGVAGDGRVVLAVTPVFDAATAALAGNADRLRIRVERDSSGTFVRIKDTTVAINPATGEATADLTVVALQNPQLFRIRLDAIRSSDGAVLFSGSQTVSVTPGTAQNQPPIQIPVTYGGPKGVRVVMAPRDTGVAIGGTFTFRATVLDQANNPVAEPVGYLLLISSDATKLSLNRLTGQATVLAGASGEVRVRAVSAGGLEDTTKVFVGALPAGVRITPGFGTVGVAQSIQLNGAVVDAQGNPVGVQGGTAWSVADPLIATVSPTGQVTGVGVGATTVVCRFNQFADSIRVTVPAAGHAVVSVMGDGRAFASPKVGDVVTVTVTADMGLTGASPEKLGSYHATLTWNPARLTFVDVVNAQTGEFATPVSNSPAAGELQLAQADPAGKGGVVVVARVRLQTIAAGDAGLSTSVTEMSAPSPSYTNFYSTSRITVVDGSVTVRP